MSFGSVRRGHAALKTAGMLGQSRKGVKTIPTKDLELLKSAGRGEHLDRGKMRRRLAVRGTPRRQASERDPGLSLRPGLELNRPFGAGLGRPGWGSAGLELRVSLGRWACAGAAL
jgi:hypothetical protein